jgi:hypothetical protein
MLNFIKEICKSPHKKHERKLLKVNGG